MHLTHLSHMFNVPNFDVFPTCESGLSTSVYLDIYYGNSCTEAWSYKSNFSWRTDISSSYIHNYACQINCTTACNRAGTRTRAGAWRWGRKRRWQCYTAINLKCDRLSEQLVIMFIIGGACKRRMAKYWFTSVGEGVKEGVQQG